MESADDQHLDRLTLVVRTSNQRTSQPFPKRQFPKFSFATKLSSSFS